MIQPIQPLIIGPSNGLGSITPHVRMPGTIGMSGPRSAGNSTLVGRSLQVTNVNLAVSNMLQEIGGGVENDKILQLLIALLILMALLENMQQQQGGMTGGSPRGSGGGLDVAQLLGMSQSSSSISIEQTTVTMSSTTITSTYIGTGDPSPSSGQQIDIAV